MKDSPRLDSELLQVESLFRLLESGQAFIRLAERAVNPYTREETLEFAEHAHKALMRLVPKSPVTPSERQRVKEGLKDLKRAIDRVRGSGS